MVIRIKVTRYARLAETENNILVRTGRNAEVETE